MIDAGRRPRWPGSTRDGRELSVHAARTDLQHFSHGLATASFPTGRDLAVGVGVSIRMTLLPGSPLTGGTQVVAQSARGRRPTGRDPWPERVQNIRVRRPGRGRRRRIHE